MPNGMIVHARYGNFGRLEGIHLNGAAFEEELDWTIGVLKQADGRFLTFDEAAGVITLRTDEGVATYRVTGTGPAPDVLRTRLESVEAADGA